MKESRNRLYLITVYNKGCILNNWRKLGHFNNQHWDSHHDREKIKLDFCVIYQYKNPKTRRKYRKIKSI